MKNEEMIRFSVNEIEKKIFINADYGTDNASANKKIGREIVKDQVMKNLGSKTKIGDELRIAIASNYVHQMVNYQIKTFLFYKKYPQFLEMR